MATSPYFGRGTLAFLRELKANNEKGWFQHNRARYEEEVRERRGSPFALQDPS